MLQIKNVLNTAEKKLFRNFEIQATSDERLDSIIRPLFEKTIYPQGEPIRQILRRTPDGGRSFKKQSQFAARQK